MHSIPRTQFSTDQVPQSDRFDVFRDSMSVLFEVGLGDNSSTKTFDASVDAFMLDQSMLARTEATSGIYNRSALDARQDGIDMIMLQLYVKGEELFRSGKIDAHVRTGDLILYDLNREAKNTITDFANISVIFPRELIETYIPTVSKWHCQVLPRGRPMTKLLKNHILSLYEIAPSLTTESCAGIQRSLLELTSSALQHSADILPKHQLTIANTVLLEIKKWINRRLANPELSPDSIAKAFSLSRAQLYRTTEPLGGIMNYIREQRLKKSNQDLRNPAFSHLSITDILYKWGFNNPGTYTRSFKRSYGMLPKDVRNLQFNDLSTSRSLTTSSQNGYDDWLRSLAL